MDYWSVLAICSFQAFELFILRLFHFIAKVVVDLVGSYFDCVIRIGVSL